MTSAGVTPSSVYAATEWPNNGAMIADVARIYLRREWPTIDVTYGKGVFWKLFRPDVLVCHDLASDGVDFRDLPHGDGEFMVSALDPSYKLHGTATAKLVEFDERYGLGRYMSVADRHRMICDGIVETGRVTAPKGFLLVKCQDQVCGGRVHWQTRIFAEQAEKCGFVLVDRFEMLRKGRPQPKRKLKPAKDGTPRIQKRPQQHALHNISTLLVLQKRAARRIKAVAS